MTLEASFYYSVSDPVLSSIYQATSNAVVRSVMHSIGVSVRNAVRASAEGYVYTYT
jgi:hypothetical protein